MKPLDSKHRCKQCNAIFQGSFRNPSLLKKWIFIYLIQFFEELIWCCRRSLGEQNFEVNCMSLKQQVNVKFCFKLDKTFPKLPKWSKMFMSNTPSGAHTVVLRVIPGIQRQKGVNWRRSSFLTAFDVHRWLSCRPDQPICSFKWIPEIVDDFDISFGSCQRILTKRFKCSTLLRNLSQDSRPKNKN